MDVNMEQRPQFDGGDANHCCSHYQGFIKGCILDVTFRSNHGHTCPDLAMKLSFSMQVFSLPQREKTKGRFICMEKMELQLRSLVLKVLMDK